MKLLVEKEREVALETLSVIFLLEWCSNRLFFSNLREK